MPAKLLDDAAVDAFLEGAPAWSRDGDAIRRTFQAPSARAALALIQRIGDLAEGANHHPELSWVYDTLTIALTTHDAGGLTKKDTHLAACIDDVLEG
ncbi:MAG TPA: 4a-hydroxytetrahydrobiopterin dehydratase [Polyangiaceae bacterium LLY-WYZ-15_(1-7)]|nr:4a-hydroxytetrahydrobiopterin dehydratase [Sandaracinus sp.]HJK89936.1 4a-hydroxytetrahydrobiopterin dehydratase [Polyangiaceae bacterium LLY-WYZ-15_(1-7)]MBJ74306.1 4a-hydroxytetrahydrobiopterin dehydratase [Sandaracinus sp.]HJL06001.1 4a-hydroxytetrahydrobiopterin dehydratase [Polyangiaceae bacterium LLY-WYZ-15_(1-7)]HJL10182.1 4a-hydroxytetrahydrobiopterin dehydratase [Polyangiaceae bacterium LLY-WYZ-15_(1-7)]